MTDVTELASNRALFKQVIRERNACPAGMSHFRHGLKCVVCDADIPSCGNCARSYTGRDPHTVACGCGVDDEALQDEDPTKNPIWAIRKYHQKGLLQMLLSGKTPEGADDEALSPEDGRECFMWEPKV